MADSSSHTIRKIGIAQMYDPLPANTTVSTFLGAASTTGSADGTGTAARFNQPSGIAVGGSVGYVADTNNQTIRKFTLGTSAVTTFAGLVGVSGSADGPGADARFNNPTALALDGTDNLYVADTGNAAIRKVDLTTNAVTTLAITASSSSSSSSSSGSSSGGGPSSNSSSSSGGGGGATSLLFLAAVTTLATVRYLLSRSR